MCPPAPFSPTVLDQRWGHIPIADVAFEPILSWLGDWLLVPDPIRLLAAIAEAFINGRDMGPLVTPEPVLHTLCDRTLTATLLERAATLGEQPFSSREALMITLSPASAARLLESLGQLTLLDPACGSGRFFGGRSPALGRAGTDSQGDCWFKQESGRPPVGSG